MTKQVEKRLTDLERKSKPVTGCVILWADLDGDGYWDQSPFGRDDQARRISEAEKGELEGEYESMFIVRFVKDWRERSVPVTA